MKAKHIFIFFFSLVSAIFFAQDSVRVKPQYEPNFMVGVDVLNAGIAAFSDRKLFQGFISSKISDKIHAVADLGFEKNIYDKGGYNAKASGIFAKIGGYYMIVRDPENEFNGFYLGPKLGAAFYNQEYFAVPVRGNGGGDAYVVYSPASAMSAWVEGVAGGRVQLFGSNFYIDVNLQPRFLVYTKKQEGLYPMIVPGFGRSSGKFSTGFAWNIVYKF